MKIAKYALILFLLFLFNTVNAQNQKSYMDGLGIEFGIGHNTLSWTVKGKHIIPLLYRVPADCNNIYITPNIRVNYIIDFSKNITSRVFIGCNSFGGRNNKAGYSFNALEYGLIISYKYSKLSFGFGTKINQILNAQYHYFQFKERENLNWYDKYSGNIGIRLSHFIKNFSVSAESWLGITNFYSGPLPGGNIKENHYRFLIGYHF